MKIITNESKKIKVDRMLKCNQYQTIARKTKEFQLQRTHAQFWKSLSLILAIIKFESIIFNSQIIPAPTSISFPWFLKLFTRGSTRVDILNLIILYFWVYKKIKKKKNIRGSWFCKCCTPLFPKLTLSPNAFQKIVFKYKLT